MIFSQLYEQILAENEKLKAQLRDTDLELADLKLQLEKATQVCWVYVTFFFLLCFFFCVTTVTVGLIGFLFFAEAGTLR